MWGHPQLWSHYLTRLIARCCFSGLSPAPAYWWLDLHQEEVGDPDMIEMEIIRVLDNLGGAVAVIARAPARSRHRRHGVVPIMSRKA
jgi:hypothetical protein